MTNHDRHYWVTRESLPSNRNLGTSVAELGKSGVEEAVLLKKRLIVETGICFLILESHVRIRDLRDSGQPENNSQSPDKDSDGEVDPLHVRKGGLVVEVEEDIRAHEGGDDGADTVEGLGQVDAHLGVTRRTAHRDVRVGGSLESAKAIADDEDGGAEATKGLVDDARDGDDSAETVEEETPDEGGLVAPVTENPGGVTKGGERVGTALAPDVSISRLRVCDIICIAFDSPKVSSLKTSGSRSVDVKDILEVLVQGIKKTCIGIKLSATLHSPRLIQEILAV